MWGLPQKQNARRAYKIRLCGHLRRYKKIVKKTYIISFKINKGILSIERYSKNLPLHLDVSESLGTLHYYHGRLFQIVLKDTKGNLLDCLFTGDTLYINKKDLEKMSILKVSE